MNCREVDDMFILKGEPLNIPVDKLTHNPSDIYSCLRKQWYKWKGVVGERTESDKDSLNFFTSAHDYSINLAKRKGIYVADNVKVANKQYNLSGWIDLIIKTDKIYIVEIKTISTYGFKKICIQPLKHHYIQTQCYLWLSSIADGILRYVNRDNGQAKNWYVWVDEDTVREIKDIINKINSYIAKDECPPAEGMEEWECEYCEYEGKCQEAEKDADR